jgi:tetratricopeptide (TPR) repeat protein
VDKDELIEVIASHYVDAYEAVPDADDAAEIKGRAREMLARAGERAASLAATAEAWRYFEQAARLADEPRERAELLHRAGEMAGDAGKPDAATPLLDEAESIYEGLGDTHAAARVSATYGRVLGFTGRRDEAMARLERAFEVIANDEPDEDLAMLAALLSRSYWFMGNLERATDRAELALDIAEAGDYQEALAMGLRAKGLVAWTRGHRQEATALVRQALEYALAHDLTSDASTSYFILSDSSFRYDRFSEALEYLEQALVLARKQGSRPGEWACLAEMTYPLYMLGRWDDALAMIESPSEEQTRSGGVLLSLLTSVVEIHLQRGDLGASRGIFSLFSHLEGSSDVQDLSCYLGARSLLKLVDHDYEGAVQDAEAAIETARTLGYAQQSVKQAVPCLFESAVATGDEAKARKLVGWLEQVPSPQRAPFFTGQADRFRGRLDEDEAAFAAAAETFREHGLRFWHAVTLLEHAELLARNGRASEAEHLQDDARDIFVELRATPWLERIERIASVDAAVSFATP